VGEEVIVKRFLAALALALCTAVPAVAQAPGVVSVLYAGSLVTPMEGPIRDALRAQGIDFQGQPGGSKALAHLIGAGLKSPDVFISVDPALIVGLGDKVASSTTFAGTSLGVGWTDKSKYASLFADVAAGKTTLLDALATPGLHIGRTDPKVDPKGSYTVTGVTILAGADGEHRILGDDDNPAQVFPEEDLLVRIEGGEADVGFFYRTEAVARHFHFFALPGKASLRDKVTYTIALMKNAPHPDTASAFVKFMLTGQGKDILQRAGVEYVSAALPATSAPLTGLHYLVGAWKCTYRAGAARFAYDTTYVYDRDGHTLRQIATWAGGGDEELIAYDAQRGWTAVVFDDQGTATILRATGSNPNHIAYRSVYPDAGIAVTLDRISATEYALHATVRSGGKTTTSVDTCVRS